MEFIKNILIDLKRIAGEAKGAAGKARDAIIASYQSPHKDPKARDVSDRT